MGLEIRVPDAVLYLEVWGGRVEWLNEPPQWTLEPDGTLEIVTGPETDFWRIAHYGFTADNGHAYLERVEGDFTAHVHFSGEYSAQYDQAGLMVRLDEGHWIKAGTEFEGGKICLSVVVTREFSDWSVVPLEIAPSRVWLRVTRTKDAVQVDYSLDGSRFEMLRLAYFPPAQAVGVGMMACSPKRAGFRARFTGFRLERR